jgi:hypothetical protein
MLAGGMSSGRSNFERYISGLHLALGIHSTCALLHLLLCRRGHSVLFVRHGLLAKGGAILPCIQLIVTAMLDESSSSSIVVPINDTFVNDSHSNGARNNDKPAAALPVVVVEPSQKRKRRPVDRGFCVETQKISKRNYKKRGTDAGAEFDAVWICSECKEAECMMMPEAEDLLICDGLCRRLFHYPCAGLQQVPSKDEAFICTDCKNHKHKCSFCSSYGNDDDDVFKCSKVTCGLFFHESCLAMKNVEVEIVTEASKRDDAAALDEGANGMIGAHTTRRAFVCPAHCCWTCTQTELKELDKESVGKEKKTSGRGRQPKKKPKPSSGAFESKPDSFITVRWISRL